MKRILIVDDEPDIVESLAIMLSNKGYEVITAGSGEKGIQSVAAEHPDLVLLDVMMPGIDGYETCRRLKAGEKTRHIPVLLLTALNQTDDKVQGLEAGADDFITKPFNDAELRARVEAFLRTKELRDELAMSYEKLRELEQLRDALTGMIVHDLKAPLASISGGLGVFLDEIEKTAGFPAPVHKLVKNAHGAAKRLVGLIQDILDVSRMEETKFPLKKEPVDLRDVVHECAETLASLAEQSKLTLKADVPSDPVKIVADRAIIGRVLANLASNSLKFTEEGGSVTLAARAVPDHKEVELSVSDTGIGIPADHVEKIFDKFFQSGGHEMTRKGQGLGLAFCRMAVESHGGRVWAESSPGKGSRFIVRLPAP